MPQRDGTGPNGQGPLTGRRFGNCKGSSRLNGGFGFGRRAGFGRSFFPRSFTSEEEKNFLKQELENLDLNREEIQKRLKELKD
jgi:hypothetical protein